MEKKKSHALRVGFTGKCVHSQNNMKNSRAVAREGNGSLLYIPSRYGNIDGGFVMWPGLDRTLNCRLSSLLYNILNVMILSTRYMTSDGVECQCGAAMRRRRNWNKNCNKTFSINVLHIKREEVNDYIILAVFVSFHYRY